MKKTLKFALVACFVLGFSGAYAQESTSQAHYPHYGLWSNWSVGINGGWTWRLQKETVDPAIHAFNPHERWSWGIGGFLAKELNHVWDLRFQFNYSDVDSKIKNTQLYRLENNQLQNNLNYIGEHINWDIDVTFSIIDAIKGYKDPYRKWQWYLLAGMGNTRFLPDADRHETDGDEHLWLGKTVFNGNLGMGVSWRFIDLLSVYVEPTLYAIADLPQIHNNDWVGTYLYIPIGLEFHLGVTATDRARVEQEKLLTQERFDSLAKDLEDANDELAKAKEQENSDYDKKRLKKLSDTQYDILIDLDFDVPKTKEEEKD